MAAAAVWSVDPRTGREREQVAVEASGAEVDAAVRAAHAARGALADRAVRAALLRARPPGSTAPAPTWWRPPTPRPRSGRSGSTAN